jgi:hypothetical protein
MLWIWTTWFDVESRGPNQIECSAAITKNEVTYMSIRARRASRAHVPSPSAVHLHTHAHWTRFRCGSCFVEWQRYSYLGTVVCNNIDIRRSIQGALRESVLQTIITLKDHADRPTQVVVAVDLVPMHTAVLVSELVWSNLLPTRGMHTGVCRPCLAILQ